MEQVEQKHEQPGHALECCNFVPNCVTLDGPLSPNKDFELAVTKIQRRWEDELTIEEKAAVHHLLKSNFIAAVETEAASTEATAPGLPGRLAEVYSAIAKVKEAANKTESNYVDLKFILASAAEVRMDLEHGKVHSSSAA